jgi:CRP/FNR family cyclic AMP-dependent transcriptional regulator
MQTPRRSSSNTTPAGTATPENKVWYLKHSRLFERASDETVAYCEHLFVQRVCAKGNVLFQQGDAANFVYLVKRGIVRIARRTADGKDILIAILGPGSIFGEEVVFSSVERTTIAVCTTESLLGMARAEHVYGLLTRFPQLTVNVAKYLHEQRDNALAITEDRAYLSVPERLLRQFERLAHEYGKAVKDGVLLDIRLTHADLASLNREHARNDLRPARAARSGWTDPAGRPRAGSPRRVDDRDDRTIHDETNRTDGLSAGPAGRVRGAADVGEAGEYPIAMRGKCGAFPGDDFDVPERRVRSGGRTCRERREDLARRAQTRHVPGCRG